MKIFEKVIIVFLLFIFFFVTNFGILAEVSQIKEAQAASGIGAAIGSALQAANAAMCFIPGIVWAGITNDMKACLERVLLSVWKYALYPFIKSYLIKAVTKGDFGLTWDEVKEWLYKDLVFQTAEAVLNRLGFSLCARFSLHIKLALFYSVAPDYYPKCTYERSQLAQTITEAIQRKSWEPVRRDFFRMFYIESLPPYNQFTHYWLAKDIIARDISRTQRDIEYELIFSGGFLGTRDCEKDEKGRLKTPNKCRVKTPGSEVAKLLGDEINKLDVGMLGTEILADLGSLMGMLIDAMINRVVGAGYSEVQSWWNRQKEDKENNYIKSLEEKEKINASGQNKVIQFPEQKASYNIQPTAPPSLPSPSAVTPPTGGGAGGTVAP